MSPEPFPAMNLGMSLKHSFTAYRTPLPEVLQFEVGSGKNFNYLVVDERSKTAALIDPQTDPTLPEQVITAWGLKLTHLLITHSHWDHCAGVPIWLKKEPSLELWVHPLDLHRLPPSMQTATQLKLLHDGLQLSIGSLSLEVWHTPGHSAGECCFYLDLGSPEDHAGLRRCLFTGDTLFIRDCGRTDFPDGSNEALFASLQRIKTLPPETVIFPGHHYQPESFSTLAEELRTSPPLQCLTVEDLAELP